MLDRLMDPRIPEHFSPRSGSTKGRWMSTAWLGILLGLSVAAGFQVQSWGRTQDPVPAQLPNANGSANPDRAASTDSAESSQAASSPVQTPDQTNRQPGDASVLNGSSDASAASPATPSKPVGPSLGRPATLVLVGIVTVLGLMVGLKFHAFVALVLAAFVVSFLLPGSGLDPINRVVKEFGNSAGQVGIVIAMAAIIGKCMLDSGAADRVVQTFLKVLGEKRASLAMMLAAFILAVPVFFDTVFYLLVPLARSLYRRTQKNYLKYLMAVAAGGAITHTLVPPTPGPLFVAANLGVNIGLMIMMGIAVALPSALVGLAYCAWIDKRMPIAMRSVGGAINETDEPVPHPPGLFVSLLPVLLPVLLISVSTVLTLAADSQMAARLTVADIRDWTGFQSILRDQASTPGANLAKQIEADRSMDQPTWQLLSSDEELTQSQKEAAILRLNRVLLSADLYSESAVKDVPLNSAAKGLLAARGMRMKQSDLQRFNRALLESAYPNLIAAHQWDNNLRTAATWAAIPGDANIALILAALVAGAILWRARRRALGQLSQDIEESLLSGGVIILITAAGGAFGAMLRETQVSDAIRAYFSGSALTGISLMLLAYGISALLKIAQGSSTVAMIVCSGMVGALLDPATLDFNPVYIALAIGSGSLMVSWMNDSGFWVVARMGGLTEAETLRSWTVLLMVLSLTGLATSIVLSQLIPMRIITGG